MIRTSHFCVIHSKSFPPEKLLSTCRATKSDPACSVWLLHCVFDDFWVDSSHAVYSMRANDAQMSHVDLLQSFFFDQRHAPQTVVIAGVQRGDSLRWERGRGSWTDKEIYWSGKQDDRNKLMDNLHHHLQANPKHPFTSWSYFWKINHILHLPTSQISWIWKKLYIVTASMSK